jgi:flavin reductase
MGIALMFFRVANGRTDLVEQDNFRAFKVVVEGTVTDFGKARQSLAPVGNLTDTSTAWISQNALREWPDLKNDTDWQRGLSAMIEKARPHGWIDPATGAIKAHVEWTQTAADESSVALLQDGLRQAMRRMASTVSIITTNEAGTPHGMTATAVTSLAMDPPSILISVNKSASIHDPLLRSRKFCVNLLSVDNQALSGDFSGKKVGQERFTKGRWSMSTTEPPHLLDAQASIFCDADGSLPYGTHTVIVGRVTRAHAAEQIKPLLHQNAAYGQFTPALAD